MSRLEIYTYIFEKRYIALYFKLFLSAFVPEFKGFCKGIKETFINAFWIIVNILLLLIWFIVIPRYLKQGKEIERTEEYQYYARIWSENLNGEEQKDETD